MDRVRNEEVRRRAGIERELASRSDQRVLRWFGHVERLDEYRMAKRVLIAEASGGQVRGRPRLSWMDGVKVSLGNRLMTLEATRQSVVCACVCVFVCVFVCVCVFFFYLTRHDYPSLVEGESHIILLLLLLLL